jgi:tyrosyl-tRNA synthetase
MYGKVMSVPDSAMPSFFRLVTRWTPHEIEGIERAMASNEAHPRDVKMRLAREIVSISYGDRESAAAEESFRRVFQERGTPENVEHREVEVGSRLLDFLVSIGAASTKSQARTLIAQGGVRIDGATVSDSTYRFGSESVTVNPGGKGRYIHVHPTPKSGGATD